jgi:hypothetical protein
MIKIIVILGLMLPTLAFACVVDDDGTHNCSNQPSPYVNIVKESEIEILNNYLKNSDVLTLEIKEKCSNERKKYKIDNQDKNSLISQCLCRNPQIVFKIKEQYNNLFLNNPEWKGKILMYESYGNKNRVENKVNTVRIKKIIDNNLNCKKQ